MAGRADSKLSRRRVPSVERQHIPHVGRKGSVMGYNTEFEGEFTLSKPLDGETYNVLKALADSRHDEKGMPSIWCQWVVGNDRKSIRWDGGEKFYGYIGWIKYINIKYLLPKGILLNGDVAFQGEQPKDGGRIVATNGKIEVFWNYDDPKLSNYDEKSKCWCHVPANQGVHWINHRRTVFCDFFNSDLTVSEEMDSLEQKMLGVTTGNSNALAILIDISAGPGTNRSLFRCEPQSVYQRARLMSLDEVMPYVDGERGARARLEQLYKYTIRQYKKTMCRWQNRM